MNVATDVAVAMFFFILCPFSKASQLNTLEKAWTSSNRSHSTVSRLASVSDVKVIASIGSKPMRGGQQKQMCFLAFSFLCFWIFWKANVINF